ncbi:hypothetical protein QAD02_007540 [Eretmocerus hayati]|uniref:Uncharacterized protein n=1 Tax=Eretmocerus hayati TaxID=131215 RepID=A0ACC2N4K4_9HYME|nr:hypothetical protein QAD02_007540 [Eretmocerus hayati]
MKKKRIFVKNGLRLMAKIFIEIRKLNNDIENFKNALQLRYWGEMLTAIKIVAKLLRTVESEYLRTGRVEKVFEQFREVFEEEVVHTLAYTATKSRKKQLRHVPQNEMEPEHFEISMEYVDEKRDLGIQHFSEVRDKYDLAHYMSLLKTTGIMVGEFNGRRPDQTGGCLLADYQNAKSADQESEGFKMLTEDKKQQRLKYKEMEMPGKELKGDGHSFIGKKNEDSIETSLKFRAYFGITTTNKYFFAIPTKTGEEETYMNLYPVYAKLVDECKEIHPIVDVKAIRANKVHHHHATLHGVVIEGEKTGLIAGQLGHSVGTHNAYYKERVDIDDVAITQELEGFAGQSKTLQETTTKTEVAAASLESSADIPFESLPGAHLVLCSDANSSEKYEPVPKKMEKESIINIKSIGDFKPKMNVKNRWSTEEKDAFKMAFNPDHPDTRSIFIFEQNTMH